MTIVAGCQKVGDINYSIDMTPRLISSSDNLSTSEVINSVEAATVAIKSKFLSGDAIGSGVAVASDGYILTNNHVVEGAISVTLYFANGETSGGRVVWRDAGLDLAIVKSDKNIPYVEMSSSKNLLKGQDVVAIGTPLSLQFEHTATKGIVSALNRTIEVDNSYMQNLIQHDASINPGNSGGPLFNMRGQVVGINTLKADGAEGLGFAIPIEVCFPILNRIQKGAGFETPYLGIYGFDATLAQYYEKTVERDGVYVANVASQSPAEVAGIKKDDIIIKINGENISTMLDLRVNLYSFQAGESVEFTVLRNGEIISINVILT